jgi:hypothetical protein
MRVSAAQKPISVLTSCYVAGVLERRHRVVPLRGRKCNARVMLTLLGYEVKAGRKRITCPDMTTARYLRIFAEVGMAQIRIPYDPTLTARIIPKMETALEDIRRGAQRQATDHQEEKRLVRMAYGDLRRALAKAEQSNPDQA